MLQHSCRFLFLLNCWVISWNTNLKIESTCFWHLWVNWCLIGYRLLRPSLHPVSSHSLQLSVRDTVSITMKGTLFFLFFWQKNVTKVTDCLERLRRHISCIEVLTRMCEMSQNNQSKNNQSYLSTLFLCLFGQWKIAGLGRTAAKCWARAQEAHGKTRFTFHTHMKHTNSVTKGQCLKLAVVLSEQNIWKRRGRRREKKSWWPDSWRSSMTGMLLWRVWMRTGLGV